MTSPRDTSYLIIDRDVIKYIWGGRLKIGPDVANVSFSLQKAAQTVGIKEMTIGE